MPPFRAYGSEMRKWRYGLMMRKAEKNKHKMIMAYNTYKDYDSMLGKAYQKYPFGPNGKLKYGPYYGYKDRDVHVRTRRIMYLQRKANMYRKLGSYLKRQFDEDLIRDLTELRR